MHLSNLELINLVLGLALPAVVAYVTHAKAPAQVKAVTLLALSAVGSVLATIAQSGKVDHDWRAYVGSFVLTFGTAVGSHFGLLKPTGITGTDGAVAETGLNLGAPSEVPVQTDNRPVPDDGPQDVDQDPEPIDGSPTEAGI